MPKLRHLELGFGRFNDRGLDVIFTKCRALTPQGCWSVKLEGDLEDKCSQLVVF
uniref:Uncharacterized protein n=1 Tax=Nelumbo nucifera TaxID=4432 RepID=A0A822ZB32_NELNU|nr:TPA_asm: hypothetical protein HUJ06_016063 [Nelumbo nucifera]